MENFSRAIDNLRERRLRIINGKTNCIPIFFKRFSANFPGFERKRYGIVTASQKVGKSKLVDSMLIYEPLFYMIEHPEEFKEKVLYFTLEMSKDEKFYDFLCHLLYKLDGIEIGTLDLKSTSKDNPLPEHILELIESDRYKVYIDKFQEMVTFIDDIKNPTGINKFCREYALERGVLHKKTIKTKDELTGNDKEVEIVDYFEWNDPDCYYVIILDNFTNLTRESGKNKIENIEKMSKYFITLRDQLKYHIVAVQHQAQSQEGIENRKLNMVYPTTDGLGDCKMTSRDVDYILGLFNPFKYGLREFEGYDITKFRKNIRFLMMLDDRNSGAGGDMCPLYFNGAATIFSELPLPNSPQIKKVYEFLSKSKEKSFFLYSKNKVEKELHTNNIISSFVSLFNKNK